MQLLNDNEIQHVSGADFTMVIEGQCESSMAGWINTLFANIVTGEISDGDSFQQFIDFAQNNGADWNQVHIVNLEYSNFN